MCAICNQFSCPEECPNGGKDFIYRCSHCDEGIYQGEKYFKLMGEFFHKECMEDGFTPLELLSFLGIFPRIAENEELKLTCLLIGKSDINVRSQNEK